MWICQKCKEENEDNFAICWNCQSEWGKATTIDSQDIEEETDISATITKEVQKNYVLKENGAAYGKDEKILSTVGQKFLTSFLIGDGITKISLMTTDKRIYGAGNSYSLKGKTFITLVGELKSLNSIGLEYKSNFWFLILGIPLLAAYGIGVIFIILYFLKRHRHIKINFGGEVNSFSLRGISNEEVEEFIKTTMLAKENSK